MRGWLFLAGFLVRCLLFLLGADTTLSESYEVVTPITSFKRVREGIFLAEITGKPYEGIFYQPPLILAIFQALPESFLQYFFIGVDLFCGFLLYRITILYQRVIQADDLKQSIEPQSQNLLKYLPDIALGCYLLNPWTIISCVGMSTGIISNLAIFLMVYFALSGKGVYASFFCAVASYLSLYPIVLCFPLAPIIARVKNDQVSYVSRTIRMFLLTVFFVAVLLCLSYLYLDSWDFIKKCYGFILLVPDLQPNIGLFWYFFAEVFEEFRAIFIFAFQCHIFAYPIPLVWSPLRKHPVFIVWLLLGAIATFKSYPCVGDLVIWVAFLPLFHHKLHELEYGFIAAMAYLYLTILYPVMFYLWIGVGTGNANFYYALNIITTIVNVFLMSDALAAVRKRDFLIPKELHK